MYKNKSGRDNNRQDASLQLILSRNYWYQVFYEKCVGMNLVRYYSYHSCLYISLSYCTIPTSAMFVLLYSLKFSRLKIFADFAGQRRATKFLVHNSCKGVDGSQTTKILPEKICFLAEFGKTTKYLSLENFRLYSILTCIYVTHFKYGK